MTMKGKPKATQEWQAPDTKFGMGDHYGTGIRNPIAKIRHMYVDGPIPVKKIGKPPKSLA